MSVIIPTFNRGHFVVEAVTSCINQSHRPLEIIVVDDGSTDDTYTMISHKVDDEWRGEPVRCIRQDNLGASAARNRGLAEAAGSYVQFLDSDDLLLPEKLARQVAALEQPGSEHAACCHSFGVILAAKSPMHDGTRIGFAATDSRVLCERLCDRQVLALGTPGPLWRRAWLSSNQGWREDIALGDDLEFHVRLLCRAAQLQFIDEPLFVVREHTSERLSTASRSASAIRSQLRAFMAVRESMIGAGWWSVGCQSGMLRSARTLYATALALRDSDSILGVEAWLELLARKPLARGDVRLMVLVRRLLGSRFLLFAHRLLKCAGGA